jgi:hypothetical protein
MMTPRRRDEFIKGGITIEKLETKHQPLVPHFGRQAGI